MPTPHKDMTESEARVAATNKIARAKFLFDAARCRHSVLDVTKVACLMSDRIEELERERDAQRDRADALMAEAESYNRRCKREGILP